MAASARRPGATDTAHWGDAAQAMYRAAQAVSHPGGPGLFSDLVRELAGVMRSATAFVAVFADESRRELRTLAFQLDDEPRENFIYQLEGTPCSHVVGRAFRHVPQGVAAEFPPGAIFAAAGMDSYAAYPLNDGAGAPLGLLVAMDRKPIADAALAEALLKIFAGRIVAELERSRSDEALRAAALAVSGGYGESVFAELVRYLATLLHVEAAFIARHDIDAVPDMRMMAMVCDGQSVAQGHYALDSSPCSRVLGRGFVAIPTGLRTLFPDEHIASVMGMDSYAGFPLFDRQGRALGTVGVGSRRPLVNLDRIESMLQIFAVRASAELEQLRALEALRRREQQYQAVFEGSADALAIWSRDLRIVEINRAFTRMYGFEREDVIGTILDRHIEPAARAQRGRLIRAALDGQEGLLETGGVRKDGSRFEIEVRYLPIAYAGAAHVLAVGRDLSARRAAEAERTRLEAQLRQAQKMEAIGQLTGGIAHDFNNILTSVMGYLVLGQERAQVLGDATLLRQLGSAQTAAQRARDLIAQMLAFARRQRGERRRVALAAVVRQSLELLRPVLPSSVSVDVELPLDEAGLSVTADPVQLEQVMFNLCINARDAIEGQGRIRVSLQQAQGGGHCASCRARVEPGRWVALSVADNGCGVAPESLERLFEPFFSTKEVGRGSGMGLAMVHGIVHDHGGHIDVQTQVGVGTIFRVLLPAADAATTGSAPAPSTSQRVAASPRLSGRVMLVEDDPMVGDFMAELIGGWGLDTLLMRDPLAAAAWLEDTTGPLDLLITDQTMPGLNGLELSQRACAARPGLPILLYTGDADVSAAAERPGSGVRAVVRKPIDPEALRALVRRWLVPAAS